MWVYGKHTTGDHMRTMDYFDWLTTQCDRNGDLYTKAERACFYQSLLAEGERAYFAGQPRDCPYFDGEARSLWLEGYDEARAST